MSKIPPGKKPGKRDVPDERGPYASSPCSLHELDPLYGTATMDAGDDVRAWRKAERKRLLALRTGLARDARARLDARIEEHLVSGRLLDSDCIGFYWPLRGEPDLRRLMQRLHDGGKEIALPVIVGKDQPVEFWKWDSATRMTRGEVWGLPIPSVREARTPSALVIPLVGFDEAGYRLGFGGGYYDRTLAILEPKPLCIGVGYEIGRIRTIYPQAHDVPMDAIVTEEGIERCDR